MPPEKREDPFKQTIKEWYEEAERLTELNQKNLEQVVENLQQGWNMGNDSDKKGAETKNQLKT